MAEPPQTIAASVCNLKIAISEFETVCVNVWDTAGQEVYQCLVPLYVQGADVAIIVCDISRPATFTRVKEWVKFIEDSEPDNCVILLVANKCDLDWEFARNQFDAYAESKQFSSFVTSAVNGLCVTELFMTVAQSIYHKKSKLRQGVESHVTFTSPKRVREDKKPACCRM
jgi:Ras-related protein Rab-5C